MSVIPTLKQADIFEELTNTQLELVASICSEKVYQMDEIVFEENTPGDLLYVIASGEIDIQVDPAIVGSEAGVGAKTIATLRKGQSFGEVSLVDEGRRSARARCTQDDTRLVQIPREKLMLLCDSYPHMGYRLMRNLAADLAMKIRNTDLKVREYLIWTHASKEESQES